MGVRHLEKPGRGHHGEAKFEERDRETSEQSRARLEVLKGTLLPH